MEGAQGIVNSSVILVHAFSLQKNVIWMGWVLTVIVIVFLRYLSADGRRVVYTNNEIEGADTMGYSLQCPHVADNEPQRLQISSGMPTCVLCFHEKRWMAEQLWGSYIW